MLKDYYVDLVENDCFRKWIFDFKGTIVHVVENPFQKYTIVTFGNDVSIINGLNKKEVVKKLKKYDDVKKEELLHE